MVIDPLKVIWSSNLKNTPIDIIEDWIITKLDKNSRVVESLFKDISSEMVWQEKAISILKNVIEELIAGINMNANGYDKPIWSMILPWPSWVGKTLLSKLTQKIFNKYFSNELEMVKINCADFPWNDPYGMTRIIGASAWYIWFWLKPTLHPDNVHGEGRVILFDEIEKAWPPIWNLLLSILDDGTLDVNYSENKDTWFPLNFLWSDYAVNKDGKDNENLSSVTTYFKDAIIIITTNVWNDVVENKLENNTSIGFWWSNEELSWDDIQKIIMEELGKKFRLELQWRFDYMIPFSHLSKDDVEGIVGILFNRLIHNSMQNPKWFVIEVSDDVKQYISSKLYADKGLRKFGWRFIEKFFKENIIPNIAKIINSKVFKKKDKNKFVLHIWLKWEKIFYSKVPIEKSSSMHIRESVKSKVRKKLTK